MRHRVIDREIEENSQRAIVVGAYSEVRAVATLHVSRGSSDAIGSRHETECAEQDCDQRTPNIHIISGVPI